MYKYEVYQNQKDGLWQWRMVDGDGIEIARSRIAHDHPGDCHVELIRVRQIEQKPEQIPHIFKKGRRSYVVKRRQSKEA